LGQERRDGSKEDRKASQTIDWIPGNREMKSKPDRVVKEKIVDRRLN